MTAREFYNRICHGLGQIVLLWVVYSVVVVGYHAVREMLAQ